LLFNFKIKITQIYLRSIILKINYINYSNTLAFVESEMSKLVHH